MCARTLQSRGARAKVRSPGSPMYRTRMIWFTVIGAIVCGWATLAVLGGERQRRLQRLQLDAQTSRQPAVESRAAAVVAKPARSSWPTRRGVAGTKQAQR
jgi:hypothetical protein